MNWIGNGQSDIGCDRSTNEDSFLIDNAAGLFLVADGMGGHPGGEVASELVAAELPNFVRHTVEKGHSLADPRFHTMLQEDIVAVNDLIVREGVQRGLPGMGTTFVMLLIRDDRALVIHVGDSRCYRYGDGQLTLLTRDHASTTHENVLTLVMGMEEPVQGDIELLEVGPQEEFLLCSDGLNHMLPDAEILKAYEGGPAEVVPDRLIEAAKAAGGHDNITVIHVRQPAD